MRHLLMTLALLFTAVAAYAQEPETHYDYSQVANQITAGCTTDYDKAKAIYQWLARNIAYDTSYSIYHADECWDNQRGVCQAYCELFYHLGKCVDLETIIVSGKTRKKDRHEFDPMGHAWLIVIVDKAARSGILVDPTWGAGSVNGGRFERHNNDMSWFHVDPKWMIFTHFPENEAYQMLQQPVSAEQFLRLPDLRPNLGEYGLDADTFLRRSLAGDTDFPDFLQKSGEPIVFGEMPMTKMLRVGQSYRFVMKIEPGNDACLKNGAEGIALDQWQHNGSVHWIDFVPTTQGDLDIFVGKSITTPDNIVVVSYQVAAPTGQDLENLARLKPEAMPQLQNMQGMHLFKRYGGDINLLLSQVNSGQVKQLPEFFTVRGNDYNFKILSVPLDRTLRIGQTYTFRVQLPYPAALALIPDNGDWHRTWTEEGNNIYSTTFTPSEYGQLQLAVGLNGDNYSGLMRYEVR